MTVIVWDDKTLAADRGSGDEYMRLGRNTKIWKSRGHLMGGAGTAAFINDFRMWFEAGAVPADLPPAQRDKDDFADMLVITPDRKVHKYQRSPYPIVYDNEQLAIGSGREAAMAVLLMGGDARKAVEIASLCCVTVCGGVDTLTFD